MFNCKKKIFYLFYMNPYIWVNSKDNKQDIEATFNSIVAYENSSMKNKIKKGFSNEIELFKSILKGENFLFSYGYNWGEKDNRNMFKQMSEEISIEIITKFFTQVLDYVLTSFGIGMEINEIYKKINKKNYRIKKLFLTNEEKEEFNNIISLLNLEEGKVNNSSVIYICGPPGIGKTSNVINELIKNNFTVFYINVSNILYGSYNETTVSNILWDVWQKALEVKKNKHKVAILFDESEDLIKTRNKNFLNNNNIDNILINNRLNIEKSLTIFFLYILTQRTVSVLLISNPSYDKDGNLNLDPAMSRRINYIYDMNLPSIKNLIDLWRFYINQYKIKILDDNLENIIYYLSEISYKNKLSIRTISTLASAFRNKNIYLKELLIHIKSANK
jgi:hypothetical protein